MQYCLLRCCTLLYVCLLGQDVWSVTVHIHNCLYSNFQSTTLVMTCEHLPRHTKQATTVLNFYMLFPPLKVGRVIHCHLPLWVDLIPMLRIIGPNFMFVDLVQASTRTFHTHVRRPAEQHRSLVRVFPSDQSLHLLHNARALPCAHVPLFLSPFLSLR